MWGGDVIFKYNRNKGYENYYCKQKQGFKGVIIYG